MDAHGGVEVLSPKSQLTATARQLAEEHLRTSTFVTAQDLLCLLDGKQDPLPEAAWLRVFIHNFRQKQRAVGEAPSRPVSHEWNEADWKAQARRWPYFDQLCGEWERQGWAAEKAPNKLSLVGMCLDPEHTSVVYCNPAMARSILLRMANQEYVKLCGDGTYRLMREQWGLCTIGVLAKFHAKGEKDQLPAFRTSFESLAYAITNKESERTYGFVMKAVKRIARVLIGADWSKCVRQCHCDWHAGEEAARAREFPSSIRCGDWAHFTGAAMRPKTLPTAIDGTESAAEVRVWRAGVWATVMRHARDRKVVEFVKPWICFMRTVPTALLFTTLPTYLFQTLEGMQRAESQQFCRGTTSRKSMQQWHDTCTPCEIGWVTQPTCGAPIGGPALSACSQGQRGAHRRRNRGTDTT